ncbi:MAG: DnaA/Hda family protein [Planctomycetota bacterium]
MWNTLLAAIRSRMQPEQFATWFSRAALIRLDDEVAEIAVLNDFARDWIQAYHRSAIEAAVQEVIGTPRRLKLTVDPELARSTMENRSLGTTGNTVPSATAPTQNHSPAPPPVTRPGVLWNSDVELHPRYTFENYVVGPCNRFGHAAAMGAAEQPGKSHNPFFIHGSVGVGKTHLLQAICHELLSRNPNWRILYLSCETFINHLITALQDGDTTSFRNSTGTWMFLVVDDIQLLANKERTQESSSIRSTPLQRGQADRAVLGLAAQGHPHAAGPPGLTLQMGHGFGDHAAVFRDPHGNRQTQEPWEWATNSPPRSRSTSPATSRTTCAAPREPDAPDRLQQHDRPSGGHGDGGRRPWRAS